MIDKMNTAISKLNRIIIQLHLAYVFFNCYLTKSVYFGYGIIEISENQEKALRKLCESKFLKKVELSEKFLRAVLYSRKSALGLGLMKLLTIIDALALK